MEDFKAPLQVRVKNVAKVVQVACILHNWCINARLAKDSNYLVEDDDEIFDALSS